MWWINMVVIIWFNPYTYHGSEFSERWGVLGNIRDFITGKIKEMTNWLLIFIWNFW